MDDRQQTQSDGKNSFEYFGPSELKTFMRTIKWTLLPRFNIIVPVVSGKRLKCKSLRMTGRDGHQVMIIPRITLKGLIFIQAHPYQYMKKTQQKLKFNDQLDACLNFFLSCRFNTT